MSARTRRRSVAGSAQGACLRAVSGIATRSKVMFDRLLKAPGKVRTPSGLIRAAWRVADELGWAKTYDAQYVALAKDARLSACERRRAPAPWSRTARRCCETSRTLTGGAA